MGRLVNQTELEFLFLLFQNFFTREELVAELPAFPWSKQIHLVAGPPSIVVQSLALTRLVEILFLHSVANNNFLSIKLMLLNSMRESQTIEDLNYNLIKAHSLLINPVISTPPIPQEPMRITPIVTEELTPSISSPTDGSNALTLSEMLAEPATSDEFSEHSLFEGVNIEEKDGGPSTPSKYSFWHDEAAAAAEMFGYDCLGLLL